MAKRVTPIERAIAGEPRDRRRRYEQRQSERGIERVSVLVRIEHAEFFKQLAILSRVGSADGWASIMADPLEFMETVKVQMERAERPQRSEDVPHAPLTSDRFPRFKHLL